MSVSQAMNLSKVNRYIHAISKYSYLRQAKSIDVSNRQSAIFGEIKNEHNKQVVTQGITKINHICEERSAISRRK